MYLHVPCLYSHTALPTQHLQVQQLNTLISLLLGDLSKGERQKIMSICTIDVHARDVVAKLIQQKVDNSQAFTWLSQLRHRWDEEQKHCFANICDAQFKYSYEYLGNTARLVITPLTDRLALARNRKPACITGHAGRTVQEVFVVVSKIIHLYNYTIM